MLPSDTVCSGNERYLNLIGTTPLDGLVTSGESMRPAFVDLTGDGLLDYVVTSVTGS